MSYRMRLGTLAGQSITLMLREQGRLGSHHNYRIPHAYWEVRKELAKMEGERHDRTLNKRLGVSNCLGLKEGWHHATLC